MSTTPLYALLLARPFFGHSHSPVKSSSCQPPQPQQTTPSSTRMMAMLYSQSVNSRELPFVTLRVFVFWPIAVVVKFITMTTSCEPCCYRIDLVVIMKWGIMVRGNIWLHIYLVNNIIPSNQNNSPSWSSRAQKNQSATPEIAAPS